jgi:hypothetical protein
VTATSTDKSETPPRRLALLVLDIDAPPGADAAVSALVARVAQLVRYTVAGEGVSVSDADAVVIPDLTRAQFIAALRSLKAPHG